MMRGEGGNLNSYARKQTRFVAESFKGKSLQTRSVAESFKAQSLESISSKQK